MSKALGLIVLLALLYWLAGEYSFLFVHSDSIVTAGVFASEGIALAFVLLFGKKVIPGIAAGQLVLALSHGVSLPAALFVALANSVEAWVGHYLFHRLHLDKRLSTFRDIGGLLLIIVTIQLISAVPSNTVLLLLGQLQPESFLTSLFSWWFGNVMGQMLFTPFLLLAVLRYRSEMIAEFVVYGVLFAIAVFFIELVWNIKDFMPLLSFTIPTVVLFIARKGMVFGQLFTIVIALVSSYAVYREVGPFHAQHTFNDIINYNLLVLAHLSTVFVTGVLFEERKRYEATLHEMVQEGIEKNKEQQLLMFQQSRQAQMGEMIGMIAHQWRQPLHSLALMHEVLAGKFSKNKLNAEEMEKFRKSTRKQLEFMAHTIDDFRDFFRSQKEKRAFSLNETVDSILRMIQPVLEQLGIEVRLHAPQEYKVYGQGNTLAQVVLNLINNAKDVLQERDIAQKRIDIELKGFDDEVRLCVRDNGGGIDQAALHKLFEPYFSTKSDKGGTGLGLYMSKLIVEEQFNGKIEARNEGDGACFEIVLKRVNEA